MGSGDLSSGVRRPSRKPDHFSLMLNLRISGATFSLLHIPLQGWSGPESSRKLRFPDFLTTARDGGKVVSLTHRPPLPPGNTPDTHLC